MREKSQSDKNFAKQLALRLGLTAALVVVGAAAYPDSFSAPFAFDDESLVPENPYILHLWPLSKAMSAPALKALDMAVADRNNQLADFVFQQLEMYKRGKVLNEAGY